MPQEIALLSLLTMGSVQVSMSMRLAEHPGQRTTEEEQVMMLRIPVP